MAKQKRLWLVLSLAIATGGLAGFLALTQMGTTPTKLVAAEPTRNRVAVALRDLPLGSILSAEDVRLVDWPGNALPQGYVSSAAEIVGRGLITAVRMNEPLLTSKMAEKGSGGGLPIIIPEGKRGLSIKVDQVVGVAGFVLPGTRVDVLVTLDPEKEVNDRAITKVVLQNIQVLTAGQSVERDAEGKPQAVPVVTLLVTPEEAEQLTLATAKGRVQLALRNMLDLDTVQTSGAELADLLNGPRGRSPEPRAVRVRSTSSRPAVRSSSSSASAVVETYRGGERTLSTFSSGKQ